MPHANITRIPRNCDVKGSAVWSRYSRCNIRTTVPVTLGFLRRDHRIRRGPGCQWWQADSVTRKAWCIILMVTGLHRGAAKQGLSLRVSLSMITRSTAALHGAGHRDRVTPGVTAAGGHGAADCHGDRDRRHWHPGPSHWHSLNTGTDRIMVFVFIFKFGRKLGRRCQ